MLEKIKNPDDLHKLSLAELKILATEIREFLIKNISKTGGHLAANLGVVELTIALFLEFDPYKDKIVWDVGHQSYVHKILTGRADLFQTLRQFNGLSGFPKTSESRADAFDTGHSSTSVSAAAGFAAVTRLNGNGERAVAVIGDGAMTGGMTFEALNHIGSERLPVIVVLNDNGMSISKNVSGLSKCLKKLRTTGRYFRVKENVKSAVETIPLIGKDIKRLMSGTKKLIRNVLFPNVIFEDLGFKYLGPVDGHNIDDVRTILNQAKKINEPVIVHVHTKKGKGYIHAEKNPGYFHGVQSFDEITGKPRKEISDTWSDYFGDKICEMAEKNKKIVAVTAAMTSGTGLSKFEQKFPKRFFDVAIAEQHAVTFSAAMAKGGYTPVFAVYSTFLQRAYDQIIHDVSLMKLHVVFCIDRCGPVGSDGETHQGMYDIAFMSQIPSMTILSPSNKTDFGRMLDFAVNEIDTPVAIRYPRGRVIEFEKSNSDITKAQLVKNGTDILILSVGTTLFDALSIANILENKNISVAVADVRCLKPMDKEFIKKNIDEKKLIVSIEDGIEIGGFGEHLESVISTKVLKFAYPDEPIVQGSIVELKQKYGLTPELMSKRIFEFLNNQKDN